MDDEGNQVLDAAQLLTKQVSYVDGAHNIDAQIKKMTGYNALMQGCGIQDVNSLETRTLRERMARHRALRDTLRDPDEDDDYYEEYQRKKLNRIDQELFDQ